ncbi:fused N-acetyl glucosamine specific PTS enzymes: IIC component; IIB component; IIA component [Cupriavidus taiwanensis]|uniref:Fused N-acetyl glucosamine specific PTS enzymes: IIC component IIB component IIA component n=1 Tax=Cupriavidus taiwanensis TaxID=164546 RepID=A0A976A2F8_9BURK|nr:N-acetylglucosamine-specific PTS transporter subunit IIBC [Cupriavidus taiwanensis]SOY53550.1 fused N-acetyl glucosamine specific PTS enzymes: IIC component; IIB component; IIA component [Cupriavidus taiwanensis]
MKIDLLPRVQRLGATLMLPIAVLPVAGLLLRLGQPDVFGIRVMADAGNAVFANLALLFAIGVAVGFARDHNGAAALAGAIGYLVLTTVMKTVDASLDMGVLAGIVAGALAGGLYNRYRGVALPPYLGFFAGKRFVPIVTALACLLLGIVLAHAWAPVQAAINVAGAWLTTAGPAGAFVFGLLNRLLLVTGLHHLINTLAWFVFGNYADPATGAAVAGDLHRYFAGDPGAGLFMTGFFPVMMFGLPAACLAMYHETPRPRRALVGGMLFSMALTSFLTGITEPIEFSFMFLAPVLYGLHALMTGLSMALCHLLGIRLGFTFSAGAIDYVLAYGVSSRGWLALPLGLAYALVYYGLFRFFIRRFNLPTPGRDDAVAVPAGTAPQPAAGSVAQRYVEALGGAANLVVVDACTTRLRLTVADIAAVSEPQLRALGVRGVLKRAPNVVQVVIGPQAEQVAGDIRAALEQAAPAAGAGAGGFDPGWWIEALGGAANIAAVSVVALTRLPVVVRERARVQAGRLDASPLMWTADDTAHIAFGHAADAYAAALRRALQAGPD